MSPRWRSGTRAALAVASALALAACGDAPDANTPKPLDEFIVPQAKRIVESTMRTPTAWPGPNEPVSPPPRRQALGIVPCVSSAGCQLTAQGAADAARALGWRTSTVTPVSGSPQAVNDAFRQLIDGGVDAIVWAGFPREMLGPSLAAARKANIAMVSSQAADSHRLDVPLGDRQAPQQGLGGQLGWWAIADSGGEARVVVLSDKGSLPSDGAVKGFADTLERCLGCEIVAEGEIDSANRGAVIALQTSELLKRFPETTHVFIPTGSRVAPIAIGARQAERPDVRIASTQADAAQLESMRAKTELTLDASSTVPELWTGWAAVDQLLRVLAEQDLVEHPVPIMLRTEANVDAPFFKPLSRTDAVDFEARFKSLWGVG